MTSEKELVEQLGSKADRLRAMRVVAHSDPNAKVRAEAAAALRMRFVGGRWDDAGV